MEREKLNSLENFLLKRKSKPSNNSDPESQEEHSEWENERQNVVIQNQKSNLHQKKQEKAQRKFLIKKLARYTPCYILIVIGIVVAQGISVARIPKGAFFPDIWLLFHLRVETIIALLTTTTANVLGGSYIVLRYLFPTQGGEDKESQN